MRERNSWIVRTSPAGKIDFRAGASCGPARMRQKDAETAASFCRQGAVRHFAAALLVSSLPKSVANTCFALPIWGTAFA